MSSSSIRRFPAALLLFLFSAPVLAQNAPASVSVDANAARHPISPNIYGFAFAAAGDLAATNFTLNRSGGNGTSTTIGRSTPPITTATGISKASSILRRLPASTAIALSRRHEPPM